MLTPRFFKQRAHLVVRGLAENPGTWSAGLVPLTRNRARGTIPTPLMAEYYTQRASAGLLITEATAISQQGQRYFDVPGLYGTEQAVSRSQPPAAGSQPGLRELKTSTRFMRRASKARSTCSASCKMRK